MKRSELDMSRLFGKDRAQEDVNLQKYFVRTQQYEDIASGNKELILGRKGAGKSALFSYLRTDLRDRGAITVPISPTGSDFELMKVKLDQYQGFDFSHDFRYSLAWKEILLTELAFSLMNESNFPPDFVLEGPLLKYVRANKRLKGDMVTRFVSAIVKAFSGGKISVGAFEMDVDFSGISGMTDPEQHEIREALVGLISRNDFVILVDNLDEPWDNTPQMNSWLRGLVLAMRQLKRDHQNLKIVTFLRDDIFGEIAKGSDLFDSESEILRIKWNDQDHFNLTKLVATRIASYLDKPHPTTLQECNALWEVLYPREISYYNPARQGDVKRVLDTYLIERTFSRPRELLQFCRLILERSQTEALPVPDEAVYIAEREFTNWKFRDLEGEFSKIIANLGKVILYFAGKTSGWNASREQILTVLRGQPEDQRLLNVRTNRQYDPEETLTFLYQCGFLRAVQPGRWGTRYVTSVDDPLLTDKYTKFDIHPAFRKKLLN